MEDQNNYKTLCEELRNIKFKYWTPPIEDEIEAIVKVENDKEGRVNINFYKGDIKSVFKRKDKDIACIAVPKASSKPELAEYVWFYPADWIKENKDNADKRWVSIKEGNDITIVKSAKKPSGKFETVDEKEISLEELKEAMKRKQK